MSAVITAETGFSESTTRSQLYGLLAAGFRYPSREMFEALRAGNYQSEVRECIQRLPHLSVLAAAGDAGSGPLPPLPDLPYEEFESQYVASFEVGGPEPPCPPYEGIYRSGERTQFMLRVSSFYKHFGLVMNREEGKREVADHISAELEFMHFLTFKETQAIEEGTEDLLQGYLLAQKDFLQQQLYQWLPAFVEKLEAACPMPFYVALGRLVSGVVVAELEQVKSNQTPTVNAGALS
jgi:DMSO reductase family type II enzyme chaperone